MPHILHMLCLVSPSLHSWRSVSDTLEICVRLFATPWAVACQVPLFMGILEARILEWIAMPSSRGSSQLRVQTQVSLIAGRFFTIWATWEAQFSTWQPVYKNSNTWGEKKILAVHQTHQADSASGLCIVSPVQNVPHQLRGFLSDSSSKTPFLTKLAKTAHLCLLSFS